jgi:ribosomal protein S18 acetylase RimI-like enzyme
MMPHTQTGPTATPVTIRAATEADYDAAARLFRSTMGESFALDQSLWKAVCETPSHLAIVAEDASGSVAGLAVVVVSDRIRLAAGMRRRRFHIDDLIVAPEQRRKGIGRALLEYIKAIAAREAPSYIIVNCDFLNVPARKTYEAAGLHLVRQGNDRFEIAFP